MTTARADVSETALRWPEQPALGGWYTQDEIDAVMQTLTDSADWRTGFRAKAQEMTFEDAFAAHAAVPFAIAYNGAGTAMDQVLACLDLRPGDEVISGALNFVGPHLSVLRAGARLLLAEPSPGGFNPDPEHVARLLTGRTRAILVTHMNGQVADLQPLLDLAERHPHPEYGPARIVVDAARAVGAETDLGPVGRAGWASVFSFQSKKGMTTLGEGGMITTRDEALAVRLRRLRSFGKGRLLGSNFKMTKLQAAVGLVQLRRLRDMNDRRIHLAEQRTEHLRDLRIPGLVLPPSIGRAHTHYLYNVLLPEDWGAAGRDEVRRLLAGRHGVGSLTGERPTPHGHELIARATAGQHLPAAKRTADRALHPCLHPLMSDAENREIAEAIGDAVRTAAATRT
ncbi:DegT/DnrJ/EryC1/StrS family aminotransferase [Streptomyces seoulensis]|uniref:DegT/DnrJ/EryC1/StrS family aminotransferase n=1 Tax=Streptomyces seoulensis TaxID=73044 RepID=UPI001FCC48D2|nr:DegT/DnrJ/EryC1/StrS family aminotransferase [Streptomyces seoulensis]BDH07158.1 aminotransferase [Streptomyces seoulensis]